MSSKNRNAAEILHAFAPLTDDQIRDQFDTLVRNATRGDRRAIDEEDHPSPRRGDVLRDGTSRARPGPGGRVVSPAHTVGLAAELLWEIEDLKAALARARTDFAATLVIPDGIDRKTHQNGVFWYRALLALHRLCEIEHRGLPLPDRKNRAPPVT